jgi:hypothetical protein
VHAFVRNASENDACPDMDLDQMPHLAAHFCHSRGQFPGCLVPAFDGLDRRALLRGRANVPGEPSPGDRWDADHAKVLVGLGVLGKAILTQAALGTFEARRISGP